MSIFNGYPQLLHSLIEFTGKNGFKSLDISIWKKLFLENCLKNSICIFWNSSFSLASFHYFNCYLFAANNNELAYEERLFHMNTPNSIIEILEMKSFSDGFPKWNFMYSDFPRLLERMHNTNEIECKIESNAWSKWFGMSYSINSNQKRTKYTQIPLPHSYTS